MYPLAEDTSNCLGPTTLKYVAPMYPLVQDISDMYARPLPRVDAIFLFAIELLAKAQLPQHTTTGACAPSVASPHAGG